MCDYCEGGDESAIEESDQDICGENPTIGDKIHVPEVVVLSLPLLERILPCLSRCNVNFFCSHFEKYGEITDLYMPKVFNVAG